MRTDPKQKTAVELQSDTSLILTREFAAPAERVFRAMTEPALVRRWYGLAALRMDLCEIDLRVGGKWRFVLSSPEAGTHAFSGIYREILPARRLVFTENYEPLGEGHDILVTSTFEEQDRVTRLRSTLVYRSKADRDGHIQSGMEAGASESHDRLAGVLAAIGDPSRGATK